MIAVADTSPLNYLVLIDRIRILPRLFEHVIVPAGVIGELQHPRSPPRVAAWAAHPPEWVNVVHVSTSRSWGGLGQGETEVLAFSEQRHADVVLVDERKATLIARGMGMRSIGTLGLLALAADAGMVDLSDSVASLLETNFRASPEILRHVLARRGGST